MQWLYRVCNAVLCLSHDVQEGHAHMYTYSHTLTHFFFSFLCCFLPFVNRLSCVFKAHYCNFFNFTITYRSIYSSNHVFCMPEKEVWELRTARRFSLFTNESLVSRPRLEQNWVIIFSSRIKRGIQSNTFRDLFTLSERRAARNRKATPCTVVSRYCVVDELMEMDVLPPYFSPHVCCINHQKWYQGSFASWLTPTHTYTTEHLLSRIDLIRSLSFVFTYHYMLPTQTYIRHA